MNFFRSNLKFLIKRFDTTQSQLALYVGVSQNSISNWITGVSAPDIEALVKIHQYFGCSLDALVFFNLENGKIVTDQHIETFKRIGKDNREVLGKVEPLNPGYFVDDGGLKSGVNESDQVAQWAIMGQFKGIHEKLDQLRDIGEQLLKKPGK